MEKFVKDYIHNLIRLYGKRHAWNFSYDFESSPVSVYFEYDTTNDRGATVHDFGFMSSKTGTIITDLHGRIVCFVPLDDDFTF